MMDKILDTIRTFIKTTFFKIINNLVLKNPVLNNLFQKLKGLVLLKTLPKSKRSKVLAITLFSVFTLLTVPNILLHYTNLDRFKDKLETLIFERTGQIVSLQGPLKISLFSPCIEASDIIFKDRPLSAEVLKIYPNLNSFFSDKKDLEIELLGVEYKRYKIPELYTFISFENGVIQLEGTECELIKGKKKCSMAIDLVKIDTNSEKLKYFIEHEGNNFPLAFLLTLTNGSHEILEGKDTHVKLELTAEGNDLLPIKNSLLGEIEMEITQGKFYGTDLISSLTKARSLVGTFFSKITGLENLKSKDKHFRINTPFAKLKLSAKIKNGIFNNHDLKINHHHYLVQGKGHINFLTNKVNYYIEAIYKDTHKKEGKRAQKLYSAPLIITVSGPIDKPDIKTDFDSYLKYIKKLSALKDH